MSELASVGLVPSDLPQWLRRVEADIADIRAALDWLRSQAQIAFIPELPTEYIQSFADLPFGLVDKLGIAFTKDIFGETPATTVITRHQDAQLNAFAMAPTKLDGKPIVNLVFAENLAHDLEAGGTAGQEVFAREFLTDTYSTE